MRLLIALAAITLIATACGDENTTTTPGADSAQRYTASALVLESPDHGPQLCLGGVMTSDPPQCGGPDIPNWSWDDVDAESRAGTTWGRYTVIGTYDGETFTLTEPPRVPEDPDEVAGGFADDRFATPCDEPDGGWAVVDEATATDEALETAIGYASSQPDHAGTWVDQSINTALRDDADPEDVELLANDPTKLILNIRFTGDLDRHERELRAVWGGSLCVSLAERSEAELLAIQQELHEEFDGLLGSGVDSVTGVIDVQVIVDDGSLQDELDSRYGAGIVTIDSALRPVD
jgi:hypothetical protein